MLVVCLSPQLSAPAEKKTTPPKKDQRESTVFSITKQGAQEEPDDSPINTDDDP